MINYQCSLPSGPEGIRTPDLLSAIEARSQLRYRPIYYYPADSRGKANDILLEAIGDVKQGILSIYDFLTGNGPLADNT